MKSGFETWLSGTVPGYNDHLSNTKSWAVTALNHVSNIFNGHTSNVSLVLTTVPRLQ